MAGILAVWNDCRPDQASEYEAWYQEEHLPGRVELEGFIVGRRYEAVDARRQFLTTYEVEHPSILLESAGYLNLFHNPDARTVAMMQRAFHNSCRTVCERRYVRGAVRGGVVLTLAFSTADPRSADALKQLAERNPLSSSLVHSEIWSSAEGETNLPFSPEEVLRGGDAKISSCLILEFLRPEPAIALAGKFRKEYRNSEVGIFRILCSLIQSEIF